jgi:hypothetical protein
MKRDRQFSSTNVDMELRHNTAKFEETMENSGLQLINPIY